MTIHTKAPHMTYNTREVEDFYKKIDDYYRENFDESQPRKKMYITELLHHQLQKAREEERERTTKTILSGMKPYTIKADKSVRIADLTHNQFESIVKGNCFWAEDEPHHSELDQDKN